MNKLFEEWISWSRESQHQELQWENEQ